MAKTVGRVVGDLTGANQAADAQAAAAGQANATQRYIFDQQRKDTQPWRDAGRTALGQMQDVDFLERDFTMDDFQADPGYNFRMQEAQKAIERSAAARGGLQSGRTLKELARYSQDYASNEFSNAYNRFNMDRDRRFNRLGALAGVGQTATQQMAQAGQNYANQAGANMIGAANARAAAQQGAMNTAIGLGALAFSDVNLKDNVSPVMNPIHQMLDQLEGYQWEYKNPEHGEGIHYGVLAQDLQKSEVGANLVVETPEGLAVDNQKLVHTLLATTVLMHKEIKALKKQLGGQ